jgi:hypothetical protein
LHVTFRSSIKPADPQAVGQSRKFSATQLYAGQAAVAGQIFVVSGLAAVQFASKTGSLLSILHVTVRVIVDSAFPQVSGQSWKFSAAQLYVGQAAVAGQVFVVSGLGVVQLVAKFAILPSLPMHFIVGATVDSAAPH